MYFFKPFLRSEDKILVYVGPFGQFWLFVANKNTVLFWCTFTGQGEGERAKNCVFFKVRMGGRATIIVTMGGDSLEGQEYVHDDDCDADDDDEDDNEVDNNDDSGIAITIPMLGWDLDTAGSNQRLNKTSPAQHTFMVMMIM